MGNPTDVLITWMASPSEAQIQKWFQRPVKVLAIPMPHDEGENTQRYREQFQGTPGGAHPWIIGGWPHPLRAIFQKYGITDPLRVSVMGFSQGCQGVGMILRSQDAGYVEHAIAIDGIHCAWSPVGQPNAARDNIEASCISTWKAAAAIAARPPTAMGGLPPGQRYLTITHSSIMTEGFPSTSDTSRAIEAATWVDAPNADLPPGMIGQTFDPPWVAKGIKYDHDTNIYAVGQNGLTIMGYENHDLSGVADHIYQAQIVRSNVVEKLLAARWNAVDPTAATCGGAGSVQGPSCNPVAPVIIPPDYFSHPQDASIDWAKFMPPIEPPSSSLGPFLLSMILGGGLAYGGWKALQAIRRRT